MSYPEDKDSILRELNFHIAQSKLMDADSYEFEFYDSIAQMISETYPDNLKDSELKYKLIIDASPDVIIITALDGQIILASHMAGEMLLRDTQIETEGMNIKDFFSKDIYEEIDKTLLKFIKAKELNTIKINFVKKDSSKILLEIKSQTIFNSEGSPSCIVFVIREITDRKSNASNLIYRTKLREILIEISNLYFNLPEGKFDETVNDSLKKIGEFVGADRFYIFDYDFLNLTCSNTYEWCAPGIEPQIEFLQNINLKDIPEWVNTHVKGESMFIRDVNDLEVPENVRNILGPQSIQSLLTVPVIDGKDCTGFIGFDYVNKIHDYSKDEERLLTQFSKILTNVRKKNENKADNLTKV